MGSQLVIMITNTSNIVCVLQRQLLGAQKTERALSDELRQHRVKLKTTEVYCTVNSIVMHNGETAMCMCVSACIGHLFVRGCSQTA